MDDFIRWLVENGYFLAQLIIALHGFAVAIVNLTPTPADDRWLGKSYKLIEALAGIFSAAAKAPPPNRMPQRQRQYSEGFY